MVIDIDPALSRADRFASSPEPILHRGIQSHDEIELLWLRWRSNDMFSARKKAIFLEHAIFVPRRDIFAKVLQ